MPPPISPSSPAYRHSESVLNKVLARHGLTDRQAVLAKAAAGDDGNRYLNEAELDAAARALAYRYSESVVAKVLDGFDLPDRGALLLKASSLDDGNRYLNRTELEAAARSLAARAVETGVVSDLDSTVIPSHDYAKPPPAPFPGITALLGELELGRGGRAGDVHYVTARSEERVAGIPAYLDQHGLPKGTIDTGGESSAPWVAQAEKIADISRLFEANPDQKFVLFGDTKHRDPEVYREIQRKFPERVLAVVINQATSTIAPARVEGMNLVQNYAEAAARLMKAGVLDEPAARKVIAAARSEGLQLTDAQVEALLR